MSIGKQEIAQKGFLIAFECFSRTGCHLSCSFLLQSPRPPMLQCSNPRALVWMFGCGVCDKAHNDRKKKQKRAYASPPTLLGAPAYHGTPGHTLRSGPKVWRSPLPLSQPLSLQRPKSLYPVYLRTGKILRLQPPQGPVCRCTDGGISNAALCQRGVGITAACCTDGGCW